jgi:hypothetical protein
MLRCLFYIGCSLFFCTALHAQSKSLKALKILKAPKIDGILNEEVWNEAPLATDFIINQPDFGKPASQKTEVRILYDDEAIYIGAHLYDDPSKIRRQLTARDNEQNQNTDFFAVAFDTYHDTQNAFAFIVTAANVQSDERVSSTQISNGNGGSNGGFDYNWDAIWDSRVSIVNDGWIVEMKIPYMSLRFAKKAVQDWGINFYRLNRRLNEGSYWNPVNPKTNGLVNQFGMLNGLENLTPPLRLSFLPYISTGYSTTPTSTGPVNTFMHNGGMDVKYGINQSFTMDMTLIPDFGQVQSDNVVLNLTPYELQFAENRPFFTEGTELFNKADLFYSRRIGRTPRLYDSVNTLANDSGYTLIKNPSLTQLYNATKFSGRTKNNLGIGVFNAVTAAEDAEMIDRSGKLRTIQTEPFSNYNIIVLDQALKNRSSITFTNTNVLRKLGERNANVTSLDLSLFDRKNIYNFQAKGKFSTVSASELQSGFRSEGGNDAHSGFRASTTIAKVSGIWQWDFTNTVTSDRYDPNDLGYLHNPNELVNSFTVYFNQFVPNKYFNSRNYNFNILYRSLYKPFAFRELFLNANFQHVFRNFWDISFNLTGNPNVQYDYFELRTQDQKLKRWPWTFGGAFGGTDSRKKLYVRAGIGYAISFNWPEYNPFYLVDGSVRYRFSDKFLMNFSAHKEFDPAETGWAYFEPNTNEPVIGKRHTQRMESIAGGVYNFMARMNLSIRIRHFWSRVQYINFYKVGLDGEFLSHEIPYQNGYDNNYNAFNVDAFYTWDFRPGSRLIVAWKSAMGPDASVDGSAYKTYFQNFSQTILAPQSKQLSVKFVYFIDCNQLKRKKTI